MKWKFEEEFRLDKPETIGETDRHFDLDNYKDWLEFQLAEARKQLSLFAVSRRSEQLPCFLYQDERGIFIGYHGDTNVTEEWNDYLKTR